MSPRPRTASDAAILDATARAIGRLGPSRLTLADVAAEVGLSAAALVQRFGSKRGLLLALARASSAAAGEEFGAVRAAHRSPLGALRAYAEGQARFMEPPEALANHLAFLQVDLTDPEFHRLTLDAFRAAEGEIRALLEEAVAAGELRACDGERLARAVQSMLNGSLLTWAVYREGRLRDRLRGDLDALLEPLLAEGG